MSDEKQLVRMAVAFALTRFRFYYSVPKISLRVAITKRYLKKKQYHENVQVQPVVKDNESHCLVISCIIKHHGK